MATRPSSSPVPRRRWILAGIGPVLLVVAYGMATAVDRGFTAGWPEWARGMWVAGLILGLFAGVVCTGLGFGLISDRGLASVGSGEQTQVPRVAVFLAVYAGTLAVVAGAALLLEAHFGIASERVICITGGALFALAATSQPCWLFQTYRRLGWFATVKSDITMRWILGVVGVVLLALGVFIQM